MDLRRDCGEYRSISVRFCVRRRWAARIAGSEVADVNACNRQRVIIWTGKVIPTISSESSGGYLGA